MILLCEEICIFHFNSLISCDLTGKNILVILYSQYPIKLIDDLIHYFLVAIQTDLCSFCNWKMSLPQAHTSVTHLIQYPNNLVYQGEPALAHS